MIKRPKRVGPVLMDEAKLRERFCRAVRHLWTRGMLVGADGMLCCEVHRRRYLATPTGVRRADLEPGELVCVDIGGENVQGGEGVAADVWDPHRFAYQAHMDPAGATLGASAMVEPTSVLAILSRQDGSPTLDLGGGGRLPIVDGDNAQALREALSGCTEIIVKRSGGPGLFVAAKDLATLMNRVERLEHAAAVRLAAGN